MADREQALKKLQSDWKRYRLFKRSQLNHLNNDMNKIALKLKNGKENNAPAVYMQLYQQEHNKALERIKALETLIADLELLDEEIQQGKVKVKYNNDENKNVYCSYKFVSRNSVQGSFRTTFEYKTKDKK